MSRLLKPITLAFVLLSFFVMRLTLLPGITFSQNVWDDEISWIKDSNGKSVLDFVTYRDAPGYFIFAPRFMILLSTFVPSINSISTLRIIVFAVQVLCCAAAVACIASLTTNWKFSLLLYFSLLMTYIEDLNYAHNVGYIFIFPIFYLVFKPISQGNAIRFWRIGVAALLISKPFTAVIILALVGMFVLDKTKQVRKLILLGTYCLVYLAAYIFLPNRWETPFNSDPVTILKAIFDLPWIVFAALNPLIAIGVRPSFLRLYDLQFLGMLLGVFIYLMLGLFLIHYRKRIVTYSNQFNILTKSFILIFLLNYFLVFSATDSFWVKFFPLFLLDSPQFLWMRWSAVVPLSFLLIIASMNFITPRVKIYLLSYISVQWCLLMLVANPWLRRYW
jgi:hypothetical protein